MTSETKTEPRQMFPRFRETALSQPVQRLPVQAALLRVPYREGTEGAETLRGAEILPTQPEGEDSEQGGKSLIQELSRR